MPSDRASAVRYRQIDAAGQHDGDWLCLALIAHGPHELEQRCSLVFQDRSEDRGDSREATIESHDGHLYWLVSPSHAPQGENPGTEIRIRRDVAEPPAVLDGGLGLLGLGLEDLAWVHPDIRFNRWSVWRQDDHGNRFLVAVTDCKADALKLEAAYEAKGHKQMYWIERA